jgi:hypothetical protein
MTARRSPSSIESIRRGAGIAHGVADLPTEIRRSSADLPMPPTRVKPVRITLNLPPELFRQLDHWTRDAADTTGIPRVGVQDALRAMIRGTMAVPAASAAAIDALRIDQA